MTTHLTLIRPGDIPPHIGVDGTPGVRSVAEAAGTCARQADELAAVAENAGRLVVAQARALGRGDVIEAARLGFGIGGAVRSLAGSLGELHAVLDEIAHNAGSAS